MSRVSHGHVHDRLVWQDEAKTQSWQALSVGGAWIPQENQLWGNMHVICLFSNQQSHSLKKKSPVDTEFLSSRSSVLTNINPRHFFFYLDLSYLPSPLVMDFSYHRP